MTEKTVRYVDLLAIMQFAYSETMQDIMSRRIPVRLSYALQKDMPELKKYFDEFKEQLDSIYQRYGANEYHKCDDPQKQEQMEQDIKELSEIEITLNLYTIPIDVLDCCGKDGYDLISYSELQYLTWLIDEQ